jgi:hypothetical protein
VTGGGRTVGRAAAYAREWYGFEAAISLLEFGLIVAFTLAQLSILSAYLGSKLIGLALRAPSLARFPSARQAPLEMWSYSFSAIAPALYFNIYYTVLPVLVSPEVLVRFRLVQSALVPMSFLGSLIARARIIFRNDLGGALRVFNPPAWHRPLFESALALGLPGAVACVYIGTLALGIVPMNAIEIAWAALYCGLIYHRAQLYSLLTLEIGPSSRARVALLGILLIAASLLPIGMLASPNISALYAALASVETALLFSSVLALRRGRAGAST